MPIYELYPYTCLFALLVIEMVLIALALMFATKAIDEKIKRLEREEKERKEQKPKNNR